MDIRESQTPPSLYPCVFLIISNIESTLTIMVKPCYKMLSFKFPSHVKVKNINITRGYPHLQTINCREKYNAISYILINFGLLGKLEKKNNVW